MKIAGFSIGAHDCSYAVLENGIPVIHAELERYNRIKESDGDSLQFLFDTYPDFEEIRYFTAFKSRWRGGFRSRSKRAFQQLDALMAKTGAEFRDFNHHELHAANALYSSNFEDALIITIDGGGEHHMPDGKVRYDAASVWEGRGLDLEFGTYISMNELNIGTFYGWCTTFIFGLSGGPPIGNQAGTVMGMAALGDPKRFYKDFLDHSWNGRGFDYDKYKLIAEESEQNRFDLAAGLQAATETKVRQYFDPWIARTQSRNLCLAGGVTLNCVMTGKMYDWWGDKIDRIYECPVPYDAGLAVASAQYMWHHELRNPRITWQDNFTPYMGTKYSEPTVREAIKAREDELEVKTVTDSEVLDALISKKIVSVYGGKSECGRRALGNRSILADPRHADTKDIVNEKVKHRQWFRPFAPSVLREEVKNWFTKDIDSPYMSFAIPFKPEKVKEVPAVVHFDGSARLQTVTENDNPWYYNFIKQFQQKSGVPILLNTSFNDREPIVETPTDAINCFMKTKIDHLYFYDYGLLISKK